MKKVVDSNYLQIPELKTYLSSNQKNYVVLTDYAAMEAYKGNTLESIFKSMRILSEFPKQVLILKTTGVVCGLSGRGKGLQSRLIDKSQTRDFETYCKNLESAQNGHKHFQRQIIDYGREASTQIQRVHSDASGLAESIRAMEKVYTESELRILRTRKPLTNIIIDKMIKQILLLAAFMFRDHPRINRLPSHDNLANTFIFRSALCAHTLAIRWISDGGVANMKSDGLGNDIIDMNFVAYATYFDGFLSKDNKAQNLFAEVRYLLGNLFMPSTS